MTTKMKFEAIDTSSVYVPIGFLFIAVQEGCDDVLFLSECLEKDDFSMPAEENVEIELNKILDSIKLIIEDLEKSKTESKLITTIQDIVSVTELSHDPNSAGGSFLIKCSGCVFYINWHRES